MGEWCIPKKVAVACRVAWASDSLPVQAAPMGRPRRKSGPTLPALGCGGRRRDVNLTHRIVITPLSGSGVRALRDTGR